MRKAASPYYPPRARWYSGVFSSLDLLRRHLTVARLHPPTGVPIGGALLAFVLPGMGFSLRGLRIWGYLATACCLVLAVWFVVMLGHPSGNLAFGLLLSIHATSLGYMLEPCLGTTSFRYRVMFVVGVLGALGGLIYLPARSFLQAHWFMPLRVADQVVVIKPGVRPASLKRGDWVAYSYEGSSGHGWYVRSGLGCAPILAVPGDLVVFSTNHITVNGKPLPREPHMPRAGSLVVEQKQWLIWPQVGITGARAGDDVISAALLGVARVDYTNCIGRPFHRWFWREQKL